MDRPDLAAAFGIDQDRPDLAAAFGVDSTPEVAKPKRSYAAELANTLQKGNLYGSATTAMGASEWFGAADKGIRRKESGEWDLPTMAVNDGMIGAMESAVAGVAQKFGMRSGSLGSEASANLQNTFNEFQKTHGLSDEDVSTAWADLGNISRSWKPEEKFRTLSDGRILPNPANPDWLDPDKAESLIESTGTTDEAKADMRARLPEFQKLNSQARLEGYEAAASAIKSGDALTAPLLGAADLFLGHMQSPTEWAKENNRKDFGTPQFTRDYEKNVVEPAGTFEKATRGLKGLSTTGWNNVAMQALGTGGLLGSETLGNAAASASEANQAIRAGLPDTGLAGAVYEQGPSLIMQMLPTRLLGLASKSATVASLGTYGMAGLQSASMNYADMVAQGVPEDEAREKAVKTGISTVLITAAFGARQGGGVEALPIGKEAANASLRDLFDIARSKGITNLAKSPELRKVAREFLLNAGGEAAEEGIDQYMQAFLLADPDTNLADAWEQAKTAAKIGGVTGGAADLAMNALVSAPESARAAMGLPEKTNETAPETQTEAPTEPVASVDLGNAEPLPPASGGVETTGGAPNAVQTGVETSDLTNETALQNPQPTEQPVEQPVEPPVVSQSETPLTNETAIPNEKTEPSVAPVTPDSPANPSPDAGTKPDGEQPMEDQPYLSWSNGKGKIVGGSKQTPIQKAQWIQEQVNQVNDQLGIKRAEYVKDKGVAWANKNAQKIKSGQTQELLAKRAFLESSMPKFYDKNTGEPIGFDEALAQQESPPETRREGVSEPSTESLGLQYTETVSRMQGWSKSAKDFVDAYGSAGAQQVENAAAYLILRAKETGESVVSPAAVKRAKEIRKELRKQGFKVTDPTKPTLFEQNTQGQPGIQSETRRDGGETGATPSATSEADTAETTPLPEGTTTPSTRTGAVEGVREPLKAVKSKDFTVSGNYTVETPLGTRTIFRDPETGAWLDAKQRSKGFPNTPFPYKFLGYTKKEALENLQSELPPVLTAKQEAAIPPSAEDYFYDPSVDFPPKRPVVWIRFGGLPKGDISKSGIGDVTEEGNLTFSEKGTSVYPATFIDNQWVVATAQLNGSGIVGLDELIESGRPAFLVSGEDTKQLGGDGEPLLRNAKIEAQLSSPVVPDTEVDLPTISQTPIRDQNTQTQLPVEGGQGQTQEVTNRILANLGPPVNEGFAHTVDVGGTQINLTPTENGEIEASFVTPPDLRGQGRADAAIEKMKAEADREGAVIRVNVEPLGNESPMSREQLSDWYARRGFEMSEDGKTGVYRGQQTVTGQQRYEDAKAAGLDERTASGLGAFKDLSNMASEWHAKPETEKNRQRALDLKDNVEKAGDYSPHASWSSVFIPDGNQQIKIRRNPEGGYDVVAGDSFWRPADGPKTKPSVKPGKIIESFNSPEEIIARVFGVEGSSSPAETITKTPSPSEAVTPPTETVTEAPSPSETITNEPHPTEDRPISEDNPNNAHSLKNEATNARLAQMGMPPIIKPTRFTNQQALDDAQAAFAENPDVGRNLVNAMIADPKKLPDVHDSAVLLIETANRQIAWQEARDARDAALASGDETAIAEANLRLSEARDANYQMKMLSNQQGTEQGRAFQFRKNFISDDYSLLAMENNYRDYVNGGKPLTEEQAAKVARLSEKMRQAEANKQAFTLAGELRAQAEEIRAKGGTENAEQANRLDDLADRAEAEADLVDLLSKDIERAQQKKPESFRRRVNSAIQKQAEEAMARIKARSAEPEPTDTTTLYSGLSPETAANIKDWAIVLAGKMSEKTMDIADAASWLVETFGNAIKPHIERVFGKARQIYHETEESLQGGNAPTVDQILESLDPKSELTKEDVWALARAEVIGGERGRDVLDAVHRNLKDIYPNLERDTVAELFTDYGIIRKARGPKELNRIRSIEREALKLRDLAQGQFPKRTGFQRGETDPESRNLKRDVNRGIRELEAKMREAGIEVPSDARRMKTATEARKRTMRNEIEEIQKALDTKTRRTKERGPVVQPDDEELALRQQLEVKRKEYDAVFGDETISDEERFKRMNESLDKQITEEEQSLRDGVAKRPNASKPVTPEIAEKRKRLSELRQSRRDLFDAQNPGTALEMAKDAVRTKIERLSQIIASNNVAVREKKPVAMDEELTALMETADALQDEVNERRKALPLTPEREKLNERRRVKQAEDTLAKIEAKLASGDLSVKTANPKPESPELRAVRGRIQELNRELAKRRREAPATPESVERRIQTYLKSIARRKSELDRKIASRDTTRTQREGPPKDPRITQAKHELNALHRTFNEMVMNDHLKNRTFLRRAFDRTVDVGLFLPRAALASMDISGFGRQGFRVLASNPKIAMRNFSKNFAWTEKSADEWQNALEEHPDYDLAVENGLSLPSWRPGHTLSDMEEHFQSRLAKSVPGVKHSERGYVTYLNGIRMAYFSQLVNALRMQPDGMTKNNIKGAAEFVNQMTGRGSLGKFNQYAPFLSTVFFAPRLVWSHVQTLAGIPYSAADAASGWRLGDILDRSRGREGTKAIRKLVAAERAKMTIGYSIIYSLMALGASMMGGDDEDKKAHIGTDPYSSDFGKLVTGERRVDLAGGILQPLVFLNRFLTGNFTDAGGKRVDLGNPKTPVSPDRMSVAGKFARSKLSPFAGLMVDTLSGKDYSGKPVYFDDKLASMYIPLPVSDLYESYRKLGMSGATASTLLNFSGFGTSVYGPETNAAYDSSIGKDLSRYTLIPAINTALLPTDYQVNPNWHELNPRKNKFIVEKDQ